MEENKTYQDFGFIPRDIGEGIILYGTESAWKQWDSVMEKLNKSVDTSSIWGYKQEPDVKQ